jgi:flavin reductase (DIM6/NTAB) family NADH-FMN oxidoreductase RutF
MMAVALNLVHYTSEGIRENRTFSVNIPSRDKMEITDYCGIVTGRKKDKSNLFKIFFGKTKTAPMIEQCPLCIECKLTDIHELPTIPFTLERLWGPTPRKGTSQTGAWISQR